MIQAKEIWKDIPDTNYKISNFGNLFNKKTNKFKKPYEDKYGYLTFGIFKNNKNKNVLAHRLVAKYFLSDYSETLQVNHIDFNRKNNHVANIQMVSIQQNIKHSAMAGRYVKPGESNNNCKYDDIKIMAIKTCVGFFSDSFIAEKLGLKRKYVNDIKLGKIRAN